MSSLKGELKMNFHFFNSGSSSISSLTVLAKQEHLHDNVCFKDDLAGYDHNPIVPNYGSLCSTGQEQKALKEVCATNQFESDWTLVSCTHGGQPVDHPLLALCTGPAPVWYCSGPSASHPGQTTSPEMTRTLPTYPWPACAWMRSGIGIMGG